MSKYFNKFASDTAKPSNPGDIKDDVAPPTHDIDDGLFHHIFKELIES